MKFSKDLAWLEPYIDIARSVIPRMGRLKSIYKLGVKKNIRARIYGVCHLFPNGDASIYLYTEYNAIIKLFPKPVLKKTKYTKLQILTILAHELSHLRYWTHCPKRQMLESHLTILFMSKLNSEGYVSEEVEEKEWKKEKKSIK